MNRYIFFGVAVVVFSVVTFIMISYLKEKTTKEFYPDGKLKAVYIYKHGEVEGGFTEYYPDGTVKATVSYKKGVMEDTFRLYHANGALQELSVYVNGKKSGVYKEFYPDKTVKIEGWAKEGYRDSLFYFYSSSGTRDSVIKYNRGKIMQRFVFTKQQVEYVDMTHTFSLNFPLHWDPVMEPRVLLFLRNSSSKSTNVTQTVNVTNFKRQADANIQSVVNGYLASIQAEAPSLKVLATSFSEDQCIVRYSAHYQDREFVVYTGIYLNDLSTYIITCTAEKDSLKEVEEDFKAITKSFQLIIAPKEEKLFSV